MQSIKEFLKYCKWTYSEGLKKTLSQISFLSYMSNMGKKQFLKEWLTWATENEQNRKEAINASLNLISSLNNLPKSAKLSDSDIDKICGGIVEKGGAANKCSHATIWDI